jgi:serine/threonine-protein kinase RsbW
MPARISDSLEIAATLGRIDDVRRWCSAHLRAAGVDEGVVGELELAVTEAVSNAIRHSYGEDERQRIELSLAIDAERIEFTILDRGTPFDPADVPPADPDELREGGYGLALLEQLTDGYTRHSRDDGATVVTLVKNRSG